MVKFFSKVKDLIGLPLREGSILSKIPNSELIHEDGIECDRLTEPLPNYAKAPCEHIIHGENNTWIVLGRDRKATKLSGYGGKGHMRAGAIDIVAGRGSYAIEDDPKKEINPSTTYDASKIYIAQKTDIDENFKLAKGQVGQSVAKAGIAIKSDAVRIIAREGIKLVTGTDKRNSRGASLISVRGIDLIAGNTTRDLQPLIKGKNIVNCLEDLEDLIQDICGILLGFLIFQIEFNSIVMIHNHPEIVAMMIGQGALGTPVSLVGGSTFASPLNIAAGMKCIYSLQALSMKDTLSSAVNTKLWKHNYLRPYSKRAIQSRWNTTN